MRFTVAAVGKLKEEYWRAAAKEYEKRLSRYGKIEVAEVDDIAAPEKLSDAQREGIIEKEGRRLLGKIAPEDYVIALCIDGKSLSSEELAGLLEKTAMANKGRTVFLVGGSLGLSGECVARSDCKLSLSRLTFPHQLARIMLLEQVYRAMKILHHEAYHK